LIRAKILVKGKVQNVRYRDYVKSIANALGMNGVARHCSGDVEIEVEAKSEAELDEFVRLIEKKKGAKSGIEVLNVSVVTSTQTDEQRFVRFAVE
jgi:acylphosphatase